MAAELLESRWGLAPEHNSPKNSTIVMTQALIRLKQTPNDRAALTTLKANADL